MKRKKTTIEDAQEEWQDECFFIEPREWALMNLVRRSQTKKETP